MNILRTSALVMALFLPVSYASAARKLPTVAIAREHTGTNCVSGVLTVDGHFAGFAVALPHDGERPILARLFPATFDAQLRGNRRDGWLITYKPDPFGPQVQLRLGPPSTADTGTVAIGDDLASDCGFSKRSKYRNAARMFEEYLQRFKPDASGALAIRLTIEDR